MAKHAHETPGFTPATEQEVAEILEANEAANPDEAPEDAEVLHGYGELITELEKSSERAQRATRS